MLALAVLFAPTAIGSATPARIGATSTVQLRAEVTRGALPPSTGLAVRCWLGALGGDPGQRLYDDGGHGDGGYGDLEFGFVIEIAQGTPTGDKSLPCVVEDAQGRAGDFTIDLTVIPVCGDGVVQPGEQCDDDGTEAADGCGPTCRIEPGWLCMGAPSWCVALCGDGKVVGNEECDDGNHVAGDGCAGCAREPGWSCSGEPSICVYEGYCGNGVIENGETCDDGNQTSGDGCDATCVVEDGYACTGAPSLCCSHDPDAAITCGALDAGVDAGTGDHGGGRGCSAGGAAGWLAQGFFLSILWRARSRRRWLRSSEIA